MTCCVTTNSISGDAEHRLGGIDRSLFSSLDGLAVRLISEDSALAQPLRELGQIIGRRIARERTAHALDFAEATGTILEACGLAGVVQCEILQHADGHRQMIIEGCAAALGCEIPSVGHAVCGFNEGLFEGYLRVATGLSSCAVAESRCLALGHNACEFEIRRDGNCTV